VKPKKICAFSGKRGGFGAYVPLMRAIEADPDLELMILLGDMHLAAEFGATVREAENLFPARAIHRIEMGAGRGGSALVRAENLGRCMSEAARLLERERPDIVMVHADRAEHLIVALAAVTLGIAVTHTQGGEVSGNIDDIQRHAITKLAHVHFAETEEAASRIRALGEESWRVHAVGSLYIDRILRQMYTPPGEAAGRYGIGPGERYGILILHPDTFLGASENREVAERVCAAAIASGHTWIAVYPCSDPGYDEIIEVLEQRRGHPRFRLFPNIENFDFLGLMAGAEVMLGNSSAAFVEAPYFRLPALNIGARQQGRDREANVRDVPLAVPAIREAIEFVGRDPGFRAALASCGRRYGDGRASNRVLEIVKALELNETLFRKRLVIGR